jgi:3-dehydroquinate synthase
VWRIAGQAQAKSPGNAVTAIDVLGYPIIVATDALRVLAELVGKHASAHQYAIVTDDNVAPHYLAAVRDALLNESLGTTADRVHTVVLPAGEQQKTRDQWGAITDTLLARGCARDTTILALGGGVVGDLAGFVAATYMRGIPVVQVPTTLLAMVDASVGGKTAVDTPAGKNTVGAFHPPALVVIDPSTLVSLPPRELRAGFAEVIKHAVIADEAEIDAVISLVPGLLARNTPVSALEPLIERSVRIKARVVAADEREHGLRKVLNFGHTIGHGVEAGSDYSLLHGEAVAIGMVAEARLAERVGIADAGTAAGIQQAVQSIGLPSAMPLAVSADRVFALMHADKKRRRGMLEYALPKRVGEMAGATSGWGVHVPDADSLEIIRALA